MTDHTIHGQPRGEDGRLIPRTDQAAHFWTRVDRSGPCWLWLGARDRRGYGRAWFNGRVMLSHRVAWELTYGAPPPASLQACHLCHTPPCCNPSHITFGSAAANAAHQILTGRTLRGDQSPARVRRERMARGDRNGARTHPERVPRGERQGTAKLTWTLVKELRARYARGGVSMLAIATEAGVSYTAINKVMHRRAWWPEPADDPEAF